jgi:hypothetical protein
LPNESEFEFKMLDFKIDAEGWGAAQWEGLE